jgi:hypothetical protein
MKFNAGIEFDTTDNWRMEYVMETEKWRVYGYGEEWLFDTKIDAIVHFHKISN